MKAILCTKYGGPEVLKMHEVDKPVPKDNEVLVKNYATTVTSGDVRMRKFDVPALYWIPFRFALGLTRPKQPILGVDFSGEIEAIGKNVKRFKVGDQVFGSANNDSQCYAQYVVVPEDGIITTKPNNLSLEKSAAIFFGAHTALHFLRKANIQPGQKVLIYGASGCVGTYAVQLAKYLGAEVTGICSGRNVDLVKSLGADKVIDYTKEDFTKNGETYDVIFDTQGKSRFSGSISSLEKEGYYLRSVHLYLGSIIHGLWVVLTTSKKVIGGVAHEYLEDLFYLKELVEQGHIKPVIDRRFPLEQIAEAHRYVEKGHKVGNVVITISHWNKQEEEKVYRKINEMQDMKLML